MKAEQMMEEKMKQQQQLARKVAQQVAKADNAKTMDTLLEATLRKEEIPKSSEASREQTNP